MAKQQLSSNVTSGDRTSFSWIINWLHLDLWSWNLGTPFIPALHRKKYRVFSFFQHREAESFMWITPGIEFQFLPYFHEQIMFSCLLWSHNRAGTSFFDLPRFWSLVFACSLTCSTLFELCMWSSIWVAARLGDFIQEHLCVSLT